MEKVNLNEGFLIPSTNKTKDNNPDFFGKANIRGTEYLISAWKKESKDNETYLSITADREELNQDERAAEREEFKNKYLSDKKKNENKDLFLPINQTGSIFKQKDTTKNNDYFGTIKIYEDDINFQGFALKLKDNKGGFISLKFNDGLLSKEERNEISKSIF